MRKIILSATLASLALSLAVAAAPGQAQDRVVYSTTETRHVEKTVHRDDAVGRHRGSQWKRVCSVRRVHHKRIRRCRTVRVHWSR